MQLVGNRSFDACVNVIIFAVNLVQDQELNGEATMSASPANPAWTASKAIDGDTRQNYTLNSCAITDISHHYASVWWKVWLLRSFNIAYLEIYFRSDGKT